MLIKDSRFGNKEPIRLRVARYADNNNIALIGVGAESGEPWCTYSVNMDEILPDDRVALKTWSENLGIEQILWEANVIEREACDILPGEGFVDAPVHMLTDYAKRELGVA